MNKHIKIQSNKPINIKIEEISFDCPHCIDMKIHLQNIDLKTISKNETTPRLDIICDECGGKIEARSIKINISTSL